MTPEDQEKLRRYRELQARAAAAAVPAEQVSTPVRPAVSAPPSAEDIAKLSQLQALRRKAGLQQGETGAVAPALAAEAAAAATVGAGAMAGAVAGAKGGATAGAGIGTLIAPGPGTAAGTAIGGGLGFVVGGIAGAVAGDMATRPARDILVEKGYMYPSIEGAPDFVRPYLYGAQSLGGSAAGIGAMNVLARSSIRMAPSTVGRYVNNYLDAFKQRAVFTNAREGLAALGAATGAASAAQFTKSDDPWLILAGEVAGGLAGGSSLVWNVGDWASRQFARITKRFSTSAQETDLSRILSETITKYGGDPVQTMAALEAAVDAGVELPPGLAVESPGLRAIQNLLIATDPQAAARIRTTTQAWFTAQEKLVYALRQTGNPADLKLAAGLERDLMDQYIEAAVGAAEESVAAAMSKLPLADGLEREAMGVALHDELMELTRRAKAVERELWSAVDRDIPARTDLFLMGMDSLRGTFSKDVTDLAHPAIKRFVQRLRGEAATDGADDLLAGLEDTPGLREFVGGLTGEAEPPKVWELQQMRSIVLDLQRAESASLGGQQTLVSYYGDVADLLLEQISASLPEGVDAAYDAARAYTRSFHETFSATFVGKAGRTGRQGEYRLAPELMVQYATQGRPGATALRFAQMRKAIEFLPGKGLADPENVTAIVDMQNRILRSFAADTMDVAGRIDPGKAEKFLRTYAATLEQFPDVRDDLQKALSSTEALKDLETRFQGLNTTRNANDTIRRFLEVDNPSVAVDGALRSEQPITRFTALAEESSDALPPEQRGAFVVAVMDWARGTNGDLPLPDVLNNLLMPIGKFGRAGDGPSPVDIMVREGLMTPESADFLRTMKARTDEIAARMADPMITGGDILPETLLDTILIQNLRFAGAVAGSAMRGGLVTNAGTGLQAAKQGSDLFAKVFDRLPRSRQMELLKEAVSSSSPELMLRLLKRSVTPEEQMEAVLFAAAFLLPAIGNDIAGNDGIQLDFGSGEQ